MARWLMFDKLGQTVRLPASWVPYLFGRALGVDGSKCPVSPTEVSKLPVAKAEPQRELAA